MKNKFIQNDSRVYFQCIKDEYVIVGLKLKIVLIYLDHENSNLNPFTLFYRLRMTLGLYKHTLSQKTWYVRIKQRIRKILPRRGLEEKCEEKDRRIWKNYN